MSGQKKSKSSPWVAATLQGFIRSLGLLPLPVSRGCGRLLGSLLWRVPNQFRAASLRNVDRCFPDLPQDQRRRIVRDSLISTGLSISEAGAMFHWSRERLGKLEEECVGAELMEAALGRGKGVIALGPHVGNWEYLSHAVGVRWGMVALYRPPRVTELDAYIRHSRQHLGVTELVPANASGLRRVIQVLREGGVVGILPDQEPLKGHGVFAPFFGTPAFTMTLVRRLMRRFDSSVVFGFAQRTAKGGFRVRIMAAPEGLDDDDPVRATAQLNLGVERCVRACPEQYTWSYRRFRTRPPEELAGRSATVS